jgi:hypothetical protein
VWKDDGACKSAATMQPTAAAPAAVGRPAPAAPVVVAAAVQTAAAREEGLHGRSRLFREIV